MVLIIILKNDILEALDYIKEKKLKKNAPIEKHRYIGSWTINYSLDELPQKCSKWGYFTDYMGESIYSFSGCSKPQAF